MSSSASNLSINRVETTTKKATELSELILNVEHVYSALFFFVNPTIAICGLITNTFSLVVLVRNGLHKTSNIFLLSLTLANSLYLLNAINLAELFKYILINWIVRPYFRPISFQTAAFMCNLGKVILFFSQWGIYISFSLPTVISIERCIAVYFPLQFKQVMTVRIAASMTFAVYVFWLPWMFFYSSCHVCVYYYGKDTIFTDTRITSYCSEKFDLINYFNLNVMNYLSSAVPITIVFIGSTMVIIKIALNQRVKKKITTNQKSGYSQATRTLLVVSLVFLAFTVPYLFIQYVVVGFSNLPYSVQELSYLCTETWMYLYCSSNGYIYIFSNKIFKKQLQELLRFRREKK